MLILCELIPYIGIIETISKEKGCSSPSDYISFFYPYFVSIYVYLNTEMYRLL